MSAGRVARPVQIAVSAGDSGMRNHGDTAMLLVALRRIRESLPGARIVLLGAEQETIDAWMEGIRALAGVDLLAFQRGVIPETLRRKIAGENHQTALARELAFAARFPPAIRAADQLRNLLRRQRESGDPAIAAQVFHDCAAYMHTGCGLLNDSFADRTMEVFRLIDGAARAGRMVALLGQGIGPLNDRMLFDRAADVLPRVTHLFLREGTYSLPLLQRLGVAADRITITGDDAIEAAYERRPERLGSALGVNLRRASYAALDDATLGALGSMLRETAAEIGCAIEAVPISRRHGEDDLELTCRVVLNRPLAEAESEAMLRPEAAIDAAGRCRLMVTASYHAAVFALAQGVPAVALSGSTYYEQKFQGLANEFGTGCRVAPASDPARVREMIVEAWATADAVRDRLLESARRQTIAGRAAFDGLARDLLRSSRQ